uniref:G-protein coupled receptors family 1 profile domain-containing protein n=1 Tax=Pseudonaja textilis TaxID=8673 RepID=A0A670ZEL1_PSETE
MMTNEITVNVQLSSPMYFFFRYLAWVNIGFMSTVIPKALVNIATGSKSISLAGCFIQIFLYLVLAFCNPLHYPTIMNTQICSLLVFCCLAGGLSLILVACIPLFLISLEMIHFVIAIFSLLGTLSVNIVSYVKLISTILCIPSTTGKKKAFSTCASHFTIVTITYSSCLSMYIKPKSTSGLDYNKMVALLNIVISPFLVPIIYCLRNRQVQDALKAELRQRIRFAKN